MKKLRIGIGQLNTQDDLKKNIEAIEKAVVECTDQGAQLVVFPECSTYLSQNGAREHAETLQGPIIGKLSQLARKYNVYIHNGSFIEKREGYEKLFNTSVLIDNEGNIAAMYRKIHLFDVEIDENTTYKESNRYQYGDTMVNVKTELGDFGMTICYDLRFPELFRNLAINGAKVIFVPAAFTLFTGKDHWEALLKARAIENQVYIVAPGQFGERPIKKMSFGNSMVIDPWGTVIAKASDRVCSFVADIDLDYVDHVRKVLPSLNNRVDIEILKKINIEHIK
jgi:predicted amidohydrolase